MTYTNEKKGQVLIVRLSGDLIGEDEGLDLMGFINDAINEGFIKCAIDISELRYINSSGIGVLITVLTKFRNKGGELYLINPSESVSKLLIITKLNAIFNIVNEEEEAIKSLEKV